MAEIHLITVGKLKNNNIEILEIDYLKRLKHVKVVTYSLKSQSENLLKEQDLILKKITSFPFKAPIILLTEFGKTFDSPNFSKYLFNQLEQCSNIIMVIGGAAGFGEEIKKKADQFISLSPLTFPHQIARLILIEQIYRAETIFNRHPYHK